MTMTFAPQTAVKTLKGGRSWHGGTYAWPLPTQGADGQWTPGEWTPRLSPVVCERGYHLTTEPAEWWDASGDVVAYLAEYDGATSPKADKVAVERSRLLRPLTRDELAACGIYTDGTHEVSKGKAYASGSATVRASGSATVRASGSATVEAWDSATVEASDSATVEASDSATVRASGSATVEASGSATVEAWDSAKTHVGDRSTCIAWSGTSLVLTRSDAGVIVDRRGATPKTYVKRRGVDGWRFDDGKWTQRKAKVAK